MAIQRSFGPARSSDGGAGSRITLALSDRQASDLRRLARDKGIGEADLALYLVKSGLDLLTWGEAVQPAEVLIPETLAHLRAAIEDLTQRFDTLETLPSRSGRGRGSGGRRARSDQPRGRLHEEIIAVLRDADQSMTAADIADAVRQRGRYQPRSSKAITAASISSRVSNPHYRDLFERANRKIGLADSGPD